MSLFSNLRHQPSLSELSSYTVYIVIYILETWEVGDTLNDRCGFLSGRTYVELTPHHLSLGSSIVWASHRSSEGCRMDTKISYCWQTRCACNITLVWLCIPHTGWLMQTRNILRPGMNRNGPELEQGVHTIPDSSYAGTKVISDRAFVHTWNADFGAVCVPKRCYAASMFVHTVPKSDTKTYLIHDDSHSRSKWHSTGPAEKRRRSQRFMYKRMPCPMWFSCRRKSCPV